MIEYQKAEKLMDYIAGKITADYLAHARADSLAQAQKLREKSSLPDRTG